jgi:hypothetical protein
MSSPITDRDMLIRTLARIETAPCCDFFACPGNQHRPVPMASCTQATTVWDLRRYLERHGGWCPEHEQDLARCHPPAERPAALGYNPSHGYGLCYCAPVVRDARGSKQDQEES